MGMRGPWAHPLPGFRAAPKPPSKHRFRCRECRRSFTCVRDDRRFCSGACRIRNFRRRGEISAGKSEKITGPGLKELPAGSFYTEPANIAHYVEVREPTVIQVSGTGPSGRKFVGPDAPK